MNGSKAKLGTKFLVLGGGVAVVLAAAVFGLAKFADKDVTAAAIALIGVAVTVGGSALIERHSRDRLRLDAAMRAGSLLNPTMDLPTSPAAAASGLLALTELDRSDLAVALLVDLWPMRDDGNLAGRVVVSKETAILVINSALQCEASQPGSALVAAELLCRHAAELDACQSLDWPRVLDGGWVPDVGPRAKLLLVEALVNMSVSTSASPNALRSFAVRIYGIWESDPNPHVKGCVANLIDAIVPALKKSPYRNFMQGSRDITLAQLKAAAAMRTDNTDEFLAHMMECRRKQIIEWADDCVGADAIAIESPGAWAAAWCDVSARV